MKSNRKIAIVVNQVKMDDEDMLDVAFWLSKTPAERLAEVCRLRKNYFTWANGSFPEKMEKVIHYRKCNVRRENKPPAGKRMLET